jgi:hypothetical protein
MAGTARYRTDDSRSTVSGTYWNKYLGTQTRSFSPGVVETCEDVVGNWSGDNPFSYIYVDRKPAIISGKKSSIKLVTDWPTYLQPSVLQGATYFPEMDTARLAELSVEVKAGTNPSVAHVSVPSFIGELGDVVTLSTLGASAVEWSWGFWKNYRKVSKVHRTLRSLKIAKKAFTLRDLPYLVWCRGCAILQAIAAGNITWRFGVAPMIGDLEKLLNFVDETEKRMTMLRSLQANGSIRRRMLLGYTQLPETLRDEKAIESATLVVRVKEWVRATQDLWATARWHLDPGVQLPESNMGLYDLALRLTYGITKFELLKAAWELTPWSWLVDWFTNVSTFLDSLNNSLPIHLDGMCIMQTCTCRTRYEFVSAATTGWTGFTHNVPDAYSVCTTKKRFIPAWYLAYLPTLPRMPALTGGQLSIVGSLATLKMGRWNLRKMFRGVL